MNGFLPVKTWNCQLVCGPLGYFGCHVSEREEFLCICIGFSSVQGAQDH